MQVHIVMRIGPKWGEIVDVFDTLQAAQTLAGAKNYDVGTSKDIFERQSHYNVITKPVKSKV